MAKRRDQTTGTPTRRRRQVQEEVVSQGWLDDLMGNPRTRAEREEAVNRLVIRGMTLTAIIIGGLVALGLLINFVITPNQAVASVGGETVTVAQFRERVNFERTRLVQELNSFLGQLQSMGFSDQDTQQFLRQEPYATWINEVNFPDQLGRRVLNDMVDDILIRQEAVALGISLDEENIQSTINDYFDFNPTQVALLGVEPTETPIPTETPTPFVSPTPSPTPIPTATPEIEVTQEAEATAEATEEVSIPELPTLAPSPTPSADDLRQNFERNVAFFRTEISRAAGVNVSAVDAFFERRALRDAITDVVANIETATFVDVRHILVETEQEALEILVALENGESFAQLARTVSTDTGSGARGGELGMQPASSYVPSFAEATRNAEIGAIVGPVQSDFGYHILQVRHREERPVEGSQREQLRLNAFGEWLTELRESKQDSIEIYDNWPDFVPRG